MTRYLVTTNQSDADRSDASSRNELGDTVRRGCDRKSCGAAAGQQGEGGGEGARPQALSSVYCLARLPCPPRAHQRR